MSVNVAVKTRCLKASEFIIPWTSGISGEILEISLAEPFTCRETSTEAKQTELKSNKTDKNDRTLTPCFYRVFD